jgi:hypothetical protein
LAKLALRIEGAMIAGGVIVRGLERRMERRRKKKKKKSKEEKEWKVRGKEGRGKGPDTKKNKLTVPIGLLTSLVLA